MKIIKLKDVSFVSQVVQEYKLPDIRPISFIQGREECFMFLTYPTGSIASLEVPLKDPVKLKEYKVLNSDISQVCLNLKKF